jgi:hypothetical protein
MSALRRMHLCDLGELCCDGCKEGPHAPENGTWAGNSHMHRLMTGRSNCHVSSLVVCLQLANKSRSCAALSPRCLV